VASRHDFNALFEGNLPIDADAAPWRDDDRLLLVYGGTFDPPHVAHVRQPDRVRRALGADAVVYVPAAISPHKLETPPTPAVHRLAMLRLAVGARPWARVWTDELDRAEADPQTPSYTVDTLERLRRLAPDAARLRLLIGADQLRAFDRWHRAERIVELAEPVVMVRPPDTSAAVLEALPADRRGAWRERLVAIEPMDVSSTAIRAGLRDGDLPSGLLDPAVRRYLDEHRLYRP
jgi:nicotinate-nucleotide adenylyltransferase